MIDKRCWKVFVWTALALLWASGVFAQEPPKPTDCTIEKWQALDKDPNDPAAKEACPSHEVQKLRLTVLQQKAVLIFKDYQTALNALSAAAEQTKKENGWADGTRFNMDAVTFLPPPPPATAHPPTGNASPAPQPKPEPKKQ